MLSEKHHFHPIPAGPGTGRGDADHIRKDIMKPAHRAAENPVAAC